MTKPKSILVTGATGYVGGRLVPNLLRSGYDLRVLVRDRSDVIGRNWHHKVDIVEGDVLKPQTLSGMMSDIDVAYYLIHSMNGNADFAERDLVAARNFGQAAQRAGISRIIYLGGLGDRNANLSKHLRSRQETGDALREAGVPVTEFRAAVIVGAGSISFETIRYLTERVPVMICPSWVYTLVQPISIIDVISYLTSALTHENSAGKTIDIGGSDVLTYGEMMTQYAKMRGLFRILCPVPVLTPTLSSYWVHIVTPVPSTIARPLIEGLRNTVVVANNYAQEIFPTINPINYLQSVSAALDNIELGNIETSWSDSVSTTIGGQSKSVLKHQDGMIIERWERVVNATPTKTHDVYTRLGGENGWPYMNWLWRLRGYIDRIVGGVGYRGGRRHPEDLRVGDTLDFWRVESVSPDKLLRLRAEMKLPGNGWLQFQTEKISATTSRLIQTVYFAPKGLFGFIYWYALYPIHSLLLQGTISNIARSSETPNDQSTSR